MDTEKLLEKHEELWREAREHHFIAGVRDGTLPEGAFEVWLAQDYLFVLGLLGFQARLAGRAPREDQALLVGGLVALEAELSWFERKANERDLSLDVRPLPEAETYNRFLDGLESEPYAVNAVALWAVEQAYLDAWTTASPGAEEYREFVEHWTVPEFRSYVVSLREAADGALARSDERTAHRAEAAFLSVAKLERDFWSLAFSQVWA